MYTRSPVSRAPWTSSDSTGGFELPRTPVNRAATTKRHGRDVVGHLASYSRPYSSVSCPPSYAQFTPPACLCRVRRCELSRPALPTSAFCVGVRPAVASTVAAPPDTPTLNALVWPTQFTRPYQTRQDSFIVSGATVRISFYGYSRNQFFTTNVCTVVFW